MGKIDTSGWKEFRVGELFEKLNLRFLPNRVFDKASDISEVKSEEFNLPLVNAKHSNNGIMYYGRKHEWEYEVLTIDIVADGAASTGDVYAQPQETGVLYNAYLVKPKAKCVTGLILFFLSTVIQRCVKDHFGYDNKCTWDKVKHETILLPVDKTGQPDWAYMESFMANLEIKVAESLTLLQAAKDAEKKKVDTREWGEFRVGELFEVKISKSVDKGGLEFAEDGEYDFIGRTPLNNGIQGRLNKLKFEANQEGTYSIAQIGMHVCQYRERKWYASQNIFVLTPFAEKSHKANKFIATVITRYLDCAYGEDTYATYPTAKTLPHLKIKLPVDKTGQPDWAYMEEYMKTVQEKTEGMLNQFIST